MTAACLTLLAQRRGAIWPWCKTGRRILVEAFPAAQLKYWDLPYQGYNGSGSQAKKARAEIINFLRQKVELSDSRKRCVLESADALDAVICAFAAMAVTEGYLVLQAPKVFSEFEGWIAVHQ